MSPVIQGDGKRAVVGFHHGESRAAVIDGFTIRGGSGVIGGVEAGPEPALVGSGGGVDAFFASPTVENNIVVDNKGEDGAGVSAAFGSPLIRDNRIAGNSSDYTGGRGGGLLVDTTDAAEIIGNTVKNNDWSKG